jgi:hypothetical protein
MTAHPTATGAIGQRLRRGMVGGGPGAVIGAVRRIAARLDDGYKLVAAGSSTISRQAGDSIESVDAAGQLNLRSRSERNAVNDGSQASQFTPQGISVR